ncbi:MAG: hypothetical protein LC130_21185 [Bryobacterales bacterium]|nr:hypothetical protein [Bryobacterales bacterium]
MRRSILLLLPFAAALFGQEFRATIVGRVSDSSGAVIAGARVTATNVDTNTNTNAMRSEDAVRRAFLKGEAEEYARWLHEHLDSSYEELLSEPWILDMDGTVKPLYGQQEQAVRGYNPTKQGRPSHVYQTYFIAAIRMVLDVEVQAGNQTASIYAQPGLWAWLDLAAARAMAGTGARGYCLGYGSHDGGV